MNKLTKLLSVFVIAGAIGTGVAGVAGCNSGNGGGGHTTHTYTYTDNGNGTHTGSCTGCDDTKQPENHIWGPNNKCTADGCDATKPDLGVTSVTITTEPATIKVEGTIELEATVVTSKEGVSKDVTWNIVTGKNYATIEGNVLTATAVGTVYVEAVSVADPSIKSADPVAIKIEERNIYDDLAGDTANNIIAENFEDASKFTEGKLPVYGGYSANTQPGVFVWGDGKAMTKAGSITVSNGAATHVTDGENISLVADLTGNVKDYVEGYVELKLSEIGSKHSILALKGTTGADTIVSDVVAIYTTTSNGDVGIRLGSQVVDDVKAVAGFKLVADTKYNIHFKLDMVSGLITIDITPNGASKVNLCTDLQTNIATLRTVAFVSSGSGARVSTIDNLAVNSKELTLNEVKASLGKKVDSYKTAATAHDELDLTGTGIDTAVSTAKTNVENAADVAAAKAAYAEGIAAIDAAIVAQAKVSACTIIDGLRAGEPFNGVDAAQELGNVKSAQKDLINAETTLAGVEECLAAAKKAVGAVKNDEDRKQPNANVVLKDAEGNTVMKTGASLVELSGTKVTKAQLDALVQLEENKKVEGYYKTNTEGTLSEAVDFGENGYALVVEGEAGTNVDLVLYVKIADKVETTFKLTGEDIAAAGYEENTEVGAEKFFTMTGYKDSNNKVQSAKQEGAKVNKGTAAEGEALPEGTYSKQISLTQGGVSKTGNGIKFTVESACTVKVVACSKFDKAGLSLKILSDANGNNAVTVGNLKVTDGEGTVLDNPTLALYQACLRDENGDPIKTDDNKFQTCDASDKVAYTYEFTLEAGTYYLGGSGGGAFVFELSVTCMV